MRAHHSPTTAIIGGGTLFPISLPATPLLTPSKYRGGKDAMVAASSMLSTCASPRGPASSCLGGARFDGGREISRMSEWELAWQCFEPLARVCFELGSSMYRLAWRGSRAPCELSVAGVRLYAVASLCAC